MSPAAPAPVETGSATTRLHALIRRLGPIPVATFMGEALQHPADGYYRARGTPLGAAGDFVTAPDISQMFGELLGLWLAVAWEAAGRPDPVILVELGPGRGTLMADALRATRQQTAFRRALRLHLVESSVALRREQAARLQAAAPEWHTGLDTVPDGPLLLIANEFFDALPVHQLVRSGGAWRERLVASDGHAFAFMAAPGPSPLAALIPESLRQADEGTVAEVCPAGIALAGAVAGRVARHGGAALIVDYGRAAPALGASLRAVRGHGTADILSTPGAADLSADVDFATLARVARESGAAPFGPVPQGHFLAALGIEARAARLLASATPEQARQISAARARLTDPAAMGTAFKALAILPTGASAPAGFEADP